MFKHILSVLGFMIVSFTVQGLSHFVINVTHYQSITHLRADTVITLGLLAMFIQGVILSAALQTWKGDGVKMRDGLFVSLTFGLFLASYIVLAEPAKYSVPSIVRWVTTELTVSTIQFTVFGLVLGFIHRGGTQRAQN